MAALIAILILSVLLAISRMPRARHDRSAVILHRNIEAKTAAGWVNRFSSKTFRKSDPEGAGGALVLGR
jgi:hypothetical protein